MKMMIIDNIFVIWAVETFFLIYIFSAVNNYWQDKDNLYSKWTKKVETILLISSMI